MRAFTSEKRRIEWLGGRIAAKFVTARIFEQAKGEKDNILHFPDIIVSAAKNGRPFLSTGGHIYLPGGDTPDISISHSGSIAAAMATWNGFCGIDIQKITPRVIKVQERFCIPSEMLILQASFPCRPQMSATVLTKLWAAKEALRKASNKEPLPGFLEMQLLEIQEASSHKKVTSWIFVCNVHHAGTPSNHQYRVFITVVKDYILALTARNDTLR
jgi:phosphopantetheinyl transferase